MKISLNYGWQFTSKYEPSFLSEFPKDSLKVDLPHTNKLLPYNYFDQDEYQFISTYKKEFDLKDDLKNKKIFINFEGIMVKAHIYLNGVDLGNFISAYLPFSIDVTDQVKAKNNQLIVIVDSKEDKNIPPFGGSMDYLTFGGIYRGVEIEVKPKTYLEDVFVIANSLGELKIEPKIINKNSTTLLTYSLFLKNKIIAKFNSNEYKIANPLIWDLDNPNLYTLRAVVTSQYGEDVIIRNVGFRDVEFRVNGFYLNNKYTKLIGLNRHQSYPYIGYAASKSLQEYDVALLKEKLGLNIVRCSHYPQSEDFLNACDRLGLLVFTEVPGWQYVAKDNEIWRDNYSDFIKRMVIKDRNHPSVICYGIRIDESQDDHDLYTLGNNIAHRLDSSRQTTGVRNFKNSELLEDFYSYNDFSCNNINHGLDNPKSIKKVNNKPYLVTEYLGHMFPTKPSDKYDDRVHQALLHARVIDDSYKYEKISGAIGWCFADYYTHQDFGAGDHICYHGVLDMFRNPKFASAIYASQNNKENVFEILSSLQPGDRAEANFDKTYIATNADYVELYSNNNFIGKFYPDKKTYKYMPHPVIVIDNYIGNSFKEEGINSKDSKKIADLLGYVSINGFNKLKIKQKLFVLTTLYIKYHKKYSDLVAYWNKYVAAWGGNLKLYTFKAYKNNEVVSIKQIGPSSKCDLITQQSSLQLKNQNTYDTLIINVSLVDQYHNVCIYSHLPIKVTTKGPVELLGPSLVSLEGGSTTLFIKSKNKNGNAIIKIDSELYHKEIIVKVYEKPKNI